MGDRQKFHIPDLPPGYFSPRTIFEVSPTTLDATLEKAQLSWPTVERSDVLNALSTDFAQDDPSKALLLLQYYFDAQNGYISSIGGEKRTHSGSSSMLAQTINLFTLSKGSKSTKQEMRGTQNFGGVTCYMSSTLTAMFARMENFEPLLYQQFDDPETNELATWLRLLVNMLRNGELITRDILRALLAASYNLGWCKSPGQGPPNNQQDAGEFFSFLTECLRMPLLSLRVDIAHAGREVAEDDHKLVTEQLLFLPVPGSEADGPILLEECLELYFANNISVSRPFDRITERRPTFGSTVTAANSVITASPDVNQTPTQSGRHRSYSIVSQTTGGATFRRRHTGEAEELTPSDSPIVVSSAHHRRQSSSAETTGPPSYNQLFGSDTKELRDKKNQLWTNNNEITFPAWMFLQLMPFYADPEEATKGLQNLEARQVAHHFERTRPVLGMCLKRFGFNEDGRQILNNRHVVIPHTISLPSFVADDTDGDHAFGNFKLVLESVVFHRGNSSNSGHYTSMVREDVYQGPTPTSAGSVNSQKGLWRLKSKRERSSRDSNTSSDSDDIQERWLFLDDQLPDGDKVQTVNFTTAMENNMPYLLFYRMVALETKPEFHSNRDSYMTDRLSPIISPVASTPVSPRMHTASTPSINPSFITPLGGSTPISIPSTQSQQSQPLPKEPAPPPPPSASPPRTATSGAAPNKGAVVPPVEEKKHRKKKLFRKHKDKDYARAYREEKCKVM